MVKVKFEPLSSLTYILHACICHRSLYCWAWMPC